MSDVSCRISASLFTYLENQRGISPSEVIQNVEIPEAYKHKTIEFLTDSSHRFEWDSFVTLVENIDQRIADPRWRREYMQESFSNDHEWLRFMKTACNFVLSPYRLYWLTQSLLGNSLFSSISPSFENIGQRQVRCTLKIPDNFRDCPLFFEIASYSFELMPSYLNLPNSIVEMHRTERYAEYVITLPPDRSLFGKIQKFLRTISSWPNFVNELTSQDAHLRDNYKKLISSQSQLKRIHNELEERVQQRTRELKEANAELKQQIKEREEAEQALRQAESRLFSIFNNVREVIILVDTKLKCLAINGEAEKYGVNPQQVVGKHVNRFLFPDSVARLNRLLPLLLKRKEAIQYEVPVELTDRSVWQLISLCPVIDNDGEVSAVTIVAHDISERKIMETALRKSEAKYRSLVENINVGVSAHDENDIITFCNPHLAQMLGYSIDEIVGRRTLDFIYEEHIDQAIEYLKLARQGITDQDRTLLKHKDGHLVESQTHWTAQIENGVYKGMTVFVTDITEAIRRDKEQKQFEAHLQQLQKMEAVGTLAGGVAHDFNNVLQGMYLSIALAKDNLPNGSPAQEKLATAMNYGLRGRDLVKQILAFSRNSDIEMKPLDVIPTLDDVLKLLKSTLPKTIQIIEDINVTSATILGDITQIHQVVVNLCANGVYAIQQNPQSANTLTIHASKENLSPEKAKSVGLSAGEYIRISVTDTGTGIPSHVRGRIFDPFFTTKPVGEGSGMGLAVVHGIVKNHEGSIHVETKLKEGSRFDVYFPMAHHPYVNQPLSPSAPRKTGKERILVIDDEEELAFLVKGILEKLGYQVEAYCKAPAALDYFLQDPSAFDLIFTDYSMPGLTGLEIQKRVHEIRPELPVILCTGYSDTISHGPREKVHLLMKPLEGSEIAAAIREALDETEGKLNQKNS